MGRAWPFARRFQYWMRGGVGAWEAARADLTIRAALQALNALDGSAVRTNYWTGKEGKRPTAASTAAAAAAARGAGAERTRAGEKGTVGEQIVAATAVLDRAIVQSRLLRNEYDGAATVPDCTRMRAELPRYVAGYDAATRATATAAAAAAAAAEAAGSLQPAAAPVSSSFPSVAVDPIGPDGNFQFISDGCIEDMGNAATASSPASPSSPSSSFSSSSSLPPRAAVGGTHRRLLLNDGDRRWVVPARVVAPPSFPQCDDAG